MEQRVAQAVENADLFIRQCHSEDFLKLGRVGLQMSLSSRCLTVAGAMAEI
jgi:hypothetical protein